SVYIGAGVGAGTDDCAETFGVLPGPGTGVGSASCCISKEQPEENNMTAKSNRLIMKRIILRDFLFALLRRAESIRNLSMKHDI
ncbi:MAG: hypothetical protein IJC67_04220, partial [Clostridia bacterium]|nr:hypothetical protein [Clostridia bacterium]